MSMTPEIREHFKGGEATVIGISRQTETGEITMVYTHVGQSGELELHNRPLDMFLEDVTHGGQQVPRFKVLRDATDEEIVAAIREAAKNAPSI